MEKLVLNSCQFAIDFDKLIENPTLKHLEMKEISLKENFYVECYNGMMDIWYDDVSLNENLDFLTKYPALEVLRLDKNQITEIQFASSLIHANGLAKQTPIKPNRGTRNIPAKLLATISHTPAKMAKVPNPIPWIRKRTIFTMARGIKKMLFITKSSLAFAKSVSSAPSIKRDDSSAPDRYNTALPCRQP